MYQSIGIGEFLSLWLLNNQTVEPVVQPYSGGGGHGAEPYAAYCFNATSSDQSTTQYLT